MRLSRRARRVPESKSHIQICVGSVAFEVQIKPFAVGRKSRAFLVIRRWIQPPRFTAARRHDPQMRNPRVRFQIDVYAIEHDPFAIRRRHRRADALQFHHVLECERMLLRWRLREHRGGEQKECCEKTFHKRPSFRLTPTGASSVLGRHASGVLAIAFCDRELLLLWTFAQRFESNKVRRRRMRRPARSSVRSPECDATGRARRER